MASIIATRTAFLYRLLVSRKKRRRSYRSIVYALTTLIPCKLSCKIL